MEFTKKYIYQQVATKKLSSESATKMLMELKEKENRIDDEIAIIGMACNFPQAKTYEKYWSNIKNSVTSIIKFPAKRRNDTDEVIIEHFTTKIPDNTEELYKKGGFLEEIDKFDPGFFRISPREAKLMDPWQRLFLETSYEAMEDAGYGGNKLYGTNTGVYVGRDHTNDSVYKKIINEMDPLVATGSWTGILSGRVSYIFNLCGPSVVIDTACSSGLVAVHTACEALKNNECEMALAGGIQIDALPIKGSKIAMVQSDDYIVKTFDKNANGTVWGEGVGTIVLKPLKKAKADGDIIYAVIKGSAINNDGTSNGITAPNAESQEKVILAAWKKAKINPETISYIEAHGTGTVLGDPIEIKGLTDAFRKYTDKNQFCGISSVKPSIGHLVGAAGLSSLLKAVLALKNKTLPPTVNFEDPNSYINFIDSPIYVSDQLREWKASDVPRRAGVSAFGFSGTNCHLVLEEAPELKRNVETTEIKPQILTLSAKKNEILKTLIEKYKFLLEKDDNINFKDLCYTANIGRGHYNCRLSLIVKDLQDLKEKIEILTHSDFRVLKEKWLYFSEHKIVKNSKLKKEKGELTEDERRHISKIASQKIDMLLSLENQEYETQLEELCKLYISGANFEWEKIYADQKLRKISLPIYPLERIRTWVDSKKEEKSDKKINKVINHPLLDQCIAESIYQDIFVTEFSVERHWVLSDHKVMGNYVLPGTTYLEIAREASRKYYQEGMLQFQDVIFLSPLIVKEDEVREVQTIIKKEENYLEFTIASKAEFETNWIRHAIGKILQIDENQLSENNLGKIKQQFTDETVVTLNNSGKSQSSYHLILDLDGVPQ